MTLADIVYQGLPILAILLTIIQVSPLKIDPWSWIGKAFNKDVTQRVDKLNNRVGDLEGRVDESAAIQARARILRFEGELRRHIDHTKGDFDATLRDCKSYMQYTQQHPDFENGMTEPAIEHIQNNYAERLLNNDFLV